MAPVYMHVTGTYSGTTYTEVAPTDSEADAIFQQLNELYPAVITRGPRFDITADPGISPSDLVGRIRGFYPTPSCFVAQAKPAIDFYLGAFPGDQGNFAANQRLSDGSFVVGSATDGVPFCGATGAWANANDPKDSAHELGHNVGMGHWGCENGVGGQPGDRGCRKFPIPHAGIGGIGVNLAHWRLIAPGDNSANNTPHAHDFMSYG